MTRYRPASGIPLLLLLILIARPIPGPVLGQTEHESTASPQARDQEAVVPDLAGHSLEEARQMLRDLGLRSRVESRSTTDPCAWNRILSTDPAPGTPASPNSTVTIVVGRKAGAGSGASGLVFAVVLVPLVVALVLFFLASQRINELRRLVRSTETLTQDELRAIRRLLPSLAALGPESIESRLAALENRVSGLLPAAARYGEPAQVEPRSQEPESEASHTEDAVAAYNRGLGPGGGAADFRATFRPTTVRIVPGTQTTDGVFEKTGVKTRFEKSPGGTFLLTRQGSGYQLFPQYESGRYQLIDITNCFEIERVEPRSANPYFIQEVKRAAECVPAGDGWELSAKGLLAVPD